MSRHSILFALSGLLVGGVAGFFLANAVYLRRAPESGSVSASSSVAGARPSRRETADPALNLTEEELRGAIARGDAQPQDRELQLNLGRALYLYAIQTKSEKLLPEAVRFLRRAQEARPADRETTLLLGHALFDLAIVSDPERLAEARAIYHAVLKESPADPEALTGLGRTYSYAKPPDYPRAVTFYRQALKSDAQHEAARQSLADALLNAGQTAEAEKEMAELQRFHPSSPALAGLRARLAQTGHTEGTRP